MRPILSQTAQLLAEARAQRRRITLRREQCPTTMAQAYAIQEAVGQTLGAPVRGWKVGAPDARTEPTAAPIYNIVASPARFDGSGPGVIGCEAEVAFVFGRDLPPRPSPYGDEEVLAAVRELCVAIEVCDSRLAAWQNADDLTKLADHQLNLALVTGAATREFRGIDFRRQRVRTMVDGVLIKEGVGCHAVGNPTCLLPWLARHAGTRGGLKSGDVVTTGAWLGLHALAPGVDVVVEFPGIGSAALSLCR